MSSVKASLGHTEPVAGLAGLLVLMQMIEHRACQGCAQLHILNRLLLPPMCGLQARLSTQRVPIRVGAVGVSSFGYSGTIAHTVLGIRCGSKGVARAFGTAEVLPDASKFGSQGAGPPVEGVSEEALKKRTSLGGAEAAGEGVRALPIADVQHLQHGQWVQSPNIYRRCSFLWLDAASLLAAASSSAPNHLHDLLEAEAVAGVSSFGYSGTIAHALLQGRASTPLASPSRLVYRHRSFPWHECTHPFAQLRIDHSKGATFRTPVAGTTLSLIADHVVHHRIIFPATGYLEMARSAFTQLDPDSATASALCDVFFVEPLTVGTAQYIDLAAEAASMAFEVHSLDGADDLKLHCNGQLGATRAPAATFLSHATLQERCRSPVPAVTMYETLAHAGLQYGPSYRTVKHLSLADQMAVAQLRRRRSRLGTRVHPADLDGTLQLGVVLATRGLHETKLPFAVTSAALTAARGNLQTVGYCHNATHVHVSRTLCGHPHVRPVPALHAS